MDNYWLFVLVAFVTILSPGPGILLTLTNAMRYGAVGASGGIMGIAAGSFVVAGVSATSLGVILATSTTAFSILKYIGAGYLVYMGVKLWRSSSVGLPQEGTAHQTVEANLSKQFAEAFVMQLTNPKAVFFFMSIFPQFIDLAAHYSQQFMALVVTYSALVVVVHMAYALLTRFVRRR